MKLPSTMLVLTALSIISTLAKDPFSTLVSHEAKQRKMAGISEDQYHLLPLRLSGQQQNFIMTPNNNQTIYAEAVVHWLMPNSTLSFPVFDLSQKVRIAIDEEDSNSRIKTVITREFLTQTGFRINITAGKTYRWRIESVGSIEKMVEIAVANKPITALEPQTIQTTQHYNQIEFLKEMKATLEQVKNKRGQSENQDQQDSVSNMWAWMSGVQILSLLAVLLIQNSLFERFILPSSVV